MTPEIQKEIDHLRAFVRRLRQGDEDLRKAIDDLRHRQTDLQQAILFTQTALDRFETKHVAPSKGE
jgi:chromosome segregation ATPase